MPKTTIRRALATDAPTLADLGARTFSATFGHLYPPEDLAAFLEASHAVARIDAELADPAWAHWLAEADGEAVGYAVAGPCGLPHAEVTATCGELKRIYLLPSAQGGEAGAALMTAALGWLEAEGRRPVWLGVWSQNARALAFYERRGFERVGTYRFKVGKTLDHELILRRA
jgi:ribosomal protein S18 acetylase RimI-like enzyme